jgi:hypothetical protein
VFSQRVLFMSWKPRWAIGRSTSQESSVMETSFDFEDRLDLDRRVERQRSRADGGARMAPGLAERGDEQIRGAVGDEVLLGEIGREATKTVIFTRRRTSSRSPSAAFAWASTLTAHSLAASRPAAVSRSRPRSPVAASLPSFSGSCPAVNRRSPLRMNGT